MEIYERIYYLRTEILKMSRAAFGQKLGVSSDVVNNIERNRLKNPEQKEPIYRLIAETYNVSLEWLKTGEDEMMVPKSIGEEIGSIVSAASKHDPEQAAKFFQDLLGDMSPAEIMIMYEIAKRHFPRDDE